MKKSDEEILADKFVDMCKQLVDAFYEKNKKLFKDGLDEKTMFLSKLNILLIAIQHIVDPLSKESKDDVCNRIIKSFRQYRDNSSEVN